MSGNVRDSEPMKVLAILVEDEISHHMNVIIQDSNVWNVWKIKHHILCNETFVANKNDVWMM